MDEGSFLYVLREKTWLAFDLPTAAQWEYACRAGTTTALNSGKNVTGTDSCTNTAEVGRYLYNKDDGKGGYAEHTTVGCYLPNAWGLYDMHGNVLEWCLDWDDICDEEPVTDPVGGDGEFFGTYRVCRGGCWDTNARTCRSAFFGYNYPSSCNNGLGLRLAVPVP